MSIRKILSVFVVAVAALTISSCNKNSAKGVADKFLTSFYEMDYVEAKKHATDKTKETLTTIDNLKGKFLQTAQGDLKNIKVDIVEVKEEGDKAVVTYSISDGQGMATKNVNNKKLYLVKEKGEWKVNFTKEHNMQDIKTTIDENDKDKTDTDKQ